MLKTSDLPKLRLLPYREYAGVDRNDPLRFYFWPVIGRMFRRRIEMCLAECKGGQRVLEVGFGSGVTFLNLHENYEEIYGLDLSTEVSDVAEVFGKRRIQTHLQNGSVLSMPYPDDFFDTVLLISILEHLRPSQQKQAFREVRRVLKTGGQAIYGVPIERRLMVAMFWLLGFNIRKHHFSTEKDVFSAANIVLDKVRVIRMRGVLSAFGPIYEIGHFIKRQKTEDRKQKTEDRKQNTENRIQNTGDRRQDSDSNNQQSSIVNRQSSIVFFEWLRQPETRFIKDYDDPATTLLHAKIIRKKPFLKKLYIDFYKQFEKVAFERGSRILVELGSGGGFIKEVIPNVITSDILELPNVDRVFSVSNMPFENESVDAFVMIDVLHHVTAPGALFIEALRCLKAGGKIIMIEPANTLWSRLIYKNFHHELFDTKAQWNLQKQGPLSHGNGALPWIIFSRDRKIFEEKFPTLRIVSIRNHTPLRYLLSGGLTLRQLVPSFTYPAVKALEYLLSPLNNLLGMFQTIELEKQ